MASVADIIRSHHTEIIRQWTEEANRTASARGLGGPEFRNIMPTYLTALADMHETPGAGISDQQKYVESHVSARLRQGFHVAEVVEEFALLGRCITRMWSNAPLGQQPDVQDVERLFTELHAASTAVTDLFSKHLLEDEQTEKRYLRLLQQVASEALASDGATLRDRLKEVLELILEAMGAQSVALLLYEPASQKLVTAASAGAADEAFEHYAVSLDPASFPGTVAAGGEETSTLPDARTTMLDVSDTLRNSGIHAVLGVRLPPHHALMGVLYVGVSEIREFTIREKTRLQSLGQHLSIHLDNAKLYADLKEKLEELEAERHLRERFVSVLAHDLRGPLAAAKMSAQMLMRFPEKLSERRDLAMKIDRNIERTDQMVRDLLDANRIRAGERIPLRLDECDLGGVAREVVEELNTLHGDRFVLETQERVRGIWSANELRRALWNLGSNAFKYGAADQPITFTVSRTDVGARASVHNTGPVIPRDDRESIFRPFSRTRSAQQGPARGWGLGLTLVWGCAQAHGGRVVVTSDATTGTTFTLELPWDARPFQPGAR
ncbi:histidine kinase [Corallococcus praedator]|uniref:histidine kinase n=1 Tax=Corallococcus praedator TaxID=2316724 RepID=A0ABX9Q9P0_9BACT|nr:MULTISPECIES: ATP-binding protein [Corallococcus]RKH16172.1 histidine kinase [Corallococcus sp. CA047B]RKH34993.1 histidine kinase [Corallococcus sp. CA031C]RKH97242.1 histidine kinase [Corallococcus praedator]